MNEISETQQVEFKVHYSGMIMTAKADYRFVRLNFLVVFISMLVTNSNSQAAEQSAPEVSKDIVAQMDLLIDYMAKTMDRNQEPVAEKQRYKIEESMLNEFLKISLDQTPEIISLVLERNRELAKSPDKIAENVASLNLAATLIGLAFVRQLDDPLPRTETARLILQALQLQQHCRGEERLAWGTEFAMIRLLPVTRSEDLLEVFAPQFSTDDQALRKKLFEVLFYKLRDFRDISALLRKNEGSLEPRLIHGLIQYDSAEAMELLAGYFIKDRQRCIDVLNAFRTLDDRQWRRQAHSNTSNEILPEEHAAVQLLAKHEQWWARLYVVEFAVNDPLLRRENSLRGFVADEHPLVREVATPLAK